MCATGNCETKISNPNTPAPNRWDPICIAVLTLATASLAALFTLVGFSNEVLASDRFRVQAMLTGAFTVVAYFVCLALVFAAIFSDEEDRKRNRAQEASGLFTIQVMAVVATAVLVVWAKL